MATETEKLKLVKPAGGDYVDVGVLNANMDKIDQFAEQIDGEYLPIYSDFNSIGLEGNSHTLNEVANALLAKFVGTHRVNKFIFQQAALTSGITDLPIGYGMLSITYHNGGRWEIVYYQADNHHYFRVDNNDGMVTLTGAKLTENYLPLSGGTLTGEITIERLGSKGVFSHGKFNNGVVNDNAINFWGYGDSVNLTHGLSIVQNSGAWMKVSKDSNYVRLFGEHNKPKGTYNGNGSSTTRTISVGGIGTTLYVSSDNGCAYVSNHGAFCWGGSTAYASGTPIYYYNGYIRFTNGTLTIASNNDYFNANGVTYSYTVI